MNKVEKIVGIIKQLYMLFIEIDKKIDIAFIVETRSEDGAEDP